MTDSKVVDAAALAADPAFARAAHRLLASLVSRGAALGWVDPPSGDEIAALLGGVAVASDAGDAALRAAYADGRLAGLGYWIRYARPTHRPHADLEKIAVDPGAQGRRIGRALLESLIGAAREARIEVLTLDFRGDNAPAAHLYQSMGFTEYGRLSRFVAVGPDRYDKVFYALDLRAGRH